jgi:hypothetical protein
MKYATAWVTRFPCSFILASWLARSCSYPLLATLKREACTTTTSNYAVHFYSQRTPRGLDELWYDNFAYNISLLGKCHHFFTSHYFHERERSKNRLRYDGDLLTPRESCLLLKELNIQHMFSCIWKRQMVTVVTRSYVNQRLQTSYFGWHRGAKPTNDLSQIQPWLLYESLYRNREMDVRHASQFLLIIIRLSYALEHFYFPVMQH